MDHAAHLCIASGYMSRFNFMQLCEGDASCNEIGPDAHLVAVLISWSVA